MGIALHFPMGLMPVGAADLLTQVRFDVTSVCHGPDALCLGGDAVRHGRDALCFDRDAVCHGPDALCFDRDAVCHGLDALCFDRDAGMFLPASTNSG